MNAQDCLQRLSDENNGILKASMAAEAGISRPTLSSFLRRNGYERVFPGIYCAPGAWTDDLYVLQLRCPNAIFSHETALYLHGLTDREPFIPSVTVKTGYNPSHLTKDGVKVYTVKSDLHEIGKATLSTPFGHVVSAYDMERTVCDVLRSRSSLEVQTVQDALKQYVKRNDKNLYKLTDYARRFRVEKILTPYLEVLL